MRVVSWNVNGIRACVKKGFADFLARSDADILGVQEVRALPEEIPEAAREPAGWHTTFSTVERRGYSGIGLYTRLAPERVETALGEPRFDVEGRFIAAHFRSERGRFAVVNAYFPNGSGKNRGQQPGPLQARLLPGGVRAGAAHAPPLPGAGDRGLQHRAPGDRHRTPQGQHRNQRLPARGAGRDRPLGWRPAGWTPFAPSIRTSRIATPGGRNGAARGSATWAGGSTMCSPRRPR